MGKKKCVAVDAEPGFYEQVRDVFVAARQFVHKTANFAMVKAYWLVGKMIVEKQGGEANPTFHVRNESQRFARAFVSFLELSNKGLHYTPADAVCAASELTFGGGCAGSVSPSWFKRILTSSFGST